MAVGAGGSFDERFLRLPARVVETAMQSHQRYFPLGGNGFAIVANGGDPALVRIGERTRSRGRLEDAAFTFERDAALGVDKLAERLGEITFFAGAGTFADKTQRLVGLVRELGGDEVAVEAARLAKADQASELVREFPELEGHIGAEYARLAGYPDDVCAAIDEQYLPDAAEAPLPATEAGRVLAAADKLDTLGLLSGSATSRPARATRTRSVERRSASAGSRSKAGSPSGSKTRRCVTSSKSGSRVSWTSPSSPCGRRGAQAWTTSVRSPSSPASSAACPTSAWGPCTRSTRGPRGIVGDSVDTAPVNRILLREDAERELADALDAFEPTGELEPDFAAAAALAPVVERFFEDVLVMDPDEDLRANRLRLLRNVRTKVGRWATFRRSLASPPGSLPPGERRATAGRAAHRLRRDR